MKAFFKRVSPIRAAKDLRLYMHSRKPHEIFFLFPAIIITVLILVGLYKDAQFATPYKRNIVYVESWPMTRTGEEISAQQKIDQAVKREQKADWERRQKKHQQGFQKVDKWLTESGL